MPEIAEVEAVRKDLLRVLKGKRITTVSAVSDKLVLSGISAPELSRALKGRLVRGAGRKGKYFWLELDKKPWPLFHLGMTGRVECFKGEARSLEPPSKNPAADKFLKLALRTSNGGS